MDAEGFDLNTKAGERELRKRLNELGTDDRVINELVSNMKALDSALENPGGLVFTNHPQFGNVTEADIQATMIAKRMTRDQVIKSIEESQ